MLNRIIDRIRLPFRKEKELFSSLYHIIGVYPHNISYYQQALMHKSVAHRSANGKPVNNERLEFLGDAILDAVVGDIVYRHFEGKREGFLTNTRSKIVQRETLNKLAHEMGINQLILSSGHTSSHNSYMGGNAFEALVGAIYLDHGYDACMNFMEKKILNQLINLDKVAYKEVNFKSKLIEWTQKNRVQMEFRLLQQKKDDNNSPVFTYQVVLEGIIGGEGTGYSKKESQQAAAKQTLDRLRKKPQFIDAVFAAKTDRTKMEEEPVQTVPDAEEEKEDFIIVKSDSPSESKESAKARKKADSEKPSTADETKATATAKPENTGSKQDKTGNKPGKTGEKQELTNTKSVNDDADDMFDLSDITATPRELTKEEIIAAAEAAAFAE